MRPYPNNQELEDIVFPYDEIATVVGVPNLPLVQQMSSNPIREGRSVILTSGPPPHSSGIVNASAKTS